MKTIKKIAAFAIILASALPLLLVLNEGTSILPNIAGLLYGVLLYRYGSRIYPSFVIEYLDGIDDKGEEWEA